MTTDYKQDIPASTASNAFANTSFSPERRGEQAREDYAMVVTGTVAKIRELLAGHVDSSTVDDEVSKFRDGYKSLVTDQLHKSSRVASTMITGPSNFPVRRNQKRLDSLDKQTSKVLSYPGEFLDRIRRRYLKHEGHTIHADDPDAVDKLQERITSLEADQERMKEINKVCRSKKLSETEKLFILPGYESYVLSNNNANIKRLKQRLAEREAVESSDLDISGNGWRVYLDDDRVCAEFDFRFDDTVKALFRGWNWSRRNGRYQRQPTANGLAHAKAIAARLQELFP